ncbi:hypothetical protein AVEN_99014-1 [Araneus ventricosus]|uniref:Ig-like domain-containing protein n=1 Tax=Araneus ventricosus TaxID=182803 RepID=A0A4Y2G7I6_ARAVE|nr:hypothetical protein AVEN_99014-1 [Araneus ventricosus]
MSVHPIPTETPVSLFMFRYRFDTTPFYTALSYFHPILFTPFQTLPGMHRHLTSLLSVAVPPVWVEEPSDSDAVLGSQIVLTCAATAHPPPRVTWRKIQGEYAPAFIDPWGRRPVGSPLSSCTFFYGGDELLDGLLMETRMVQKRMR